MIKQQVIQAFKYEFGFIDDRFVILDLLEGGGEMDYERFECLKLPSEEDNIVWHPGVYLFIGNNVVYRVGVSMINSRSRVMQHLDACTSKDGHCIWDIKECEDRSILLLNVKEHKDRHWLLAIEAFLENQFKPLIRASRIG